MNFNLDFDIIEMDRRISKLNALEKSPRLKPLNNQGTILKSSNYGLPNLQNRNYNQNYKLNSKVRFKMED